MPVSGSLVGITGRIRRRMSLRCLPVIAGLPLTLSVTAVIGVVMAVVVLVPLLAEQERR